MPKQSKAAPIEDMDPAADGVESDPLRNHGLRTRPKHQVIFDFLQSGIQSGAYKPGDRLPSEAELGVTFNVSRITVAKAVAELQRLNMVTRRPGAGTHVQTRHQAEGYTFGLLIPELGTTEIFEPICHGMMRSPFARPDALLWGNASGSKASDSHADIADEAEHMGQYFIAQRVSGVFFAPLELIPEKDAVNRRIMRALDRARIPTILLDRCYLPFPERSAHDLVGIDNRRTGFQATDHLIQLGVDRLVFFAEANAAATVDARIAGFYEALTRGGIHPETEPVWRGDPQDSALIMRMLEVARPRGIVCANDVTAARLMQVLLAFGRRIPLDVRIMGIDDVKYASLLPVPLTTMRQNCAAIGVIAMATMLERLRHPDLPTRDITLQTKLIVRRSCGTHLKAE